MHYITGGGGLELCCGGGGGGLGATTEGGGGMGVAYRYRCGETQYYGRRGMGGLWSYICEGKAGLMNLMVLGWSCGGIWWWLVGFARER